MPERLEVECCSQESIDAGGSVKKILINLGLLISVYHSLWQVNKEQRSPTQFNKVLQATKKFINYPSPKKNARKPAIAGDLTGLN